jgi:ABC-type transport system involved in multi-copper enzyme maturation permease subunit
MTRIMAIALNTFREAVRNKVLYLLLLFAVGLIASALAFAQMSLHEEARVTRDIGLGGMTLFGVLIAVFIGVNLVYKELDRKTVFSLIPKPMHRFEFVLGKFGGMVLTLAVQLGIMSVVLFAVLLSQGVALQETGPVVRAIALLLCELMVVTAVAVLFSTFASPILSGAFTLGLFVIGRFTPELRELIARLSSPVVRGALSGTLRVVPDLHIFYVSGSMVDGRYVTVHGDYVDWGYVAQASGYGILYAACALALGILIFSRRDFV